MPVLPFWRVVTLPLSIERSVSASATMPSESRPSVLTVPLVMSTQPSSEMPVPNQFLIDGNRLTNAPLKLE